MTGRADSHSEDAARPDETDGDGVTSHGRVDVRATRHTRRRYNLTAPIYDLLEAPVERTLYAAWRRTLWHEVRGTEVLEIGVGTGKNIPYYPPGIQVTAVDLSSRMLQRARRVAHEHSNKRVKLLEMNAQHLELPDDTFDAAVATFVFCSVPDPVQGLREALRVTRPDGRLLLLEHVRPEGPVGRIMEFLDPVMHWATGVHIARRTVENVQKAGWTVDGVATLTDNGIFKMIVAHKSPLKSPKYDAGTS